MSVFRYESSRLTFKRDVIERMREDDILEVLVDPGDANGLVFRMTRAEIERDFPNVLASRSYLVQRTYNYKTIPSRARRYVVGAEPGPRRETATRGRTRGRPPHVPDGIGPVAWAAAVAAHAGAPAESDTYLNAVSYWRDVWRPERVRFLLVAESHVAERPGDAGVRVEHGAGSRGYCRLIYCLGYGEDSICAPAPEKNRGTPQFWDIFRSVACRSSEAVPARPGRLPWKVSVLETLRDRGIWLVDASITALAAPEGERRFPAHLQRWIIRASWERHVWPTVKRDQPQQIWVIGRGVGAALRDRPELREDRVISQPQDRNRARYQAGLARMTKEICGR